MQTLYILHRSGQSHILGSGEWKNFLVFNEVILSMSFQRLLKGNPAKIAPAELTH